MNEETVVISKILLRNFKSYREAELALAPFSILIGPNASGKSNAIEALRFIHEISDGRYLDDIYKDLVRQGVLRGSRQELVWGWGEPPREFEVGLEFEVGDRGGDYRDEWRIQIGVSPECKVRGETLKREGEKVPIYWTREDQEREAPHTLEIRYNNFARGGIKPLLRVDDRKAVFVQINTPAVFTTERAKKEIPGRLASLRRALEGIFFLEPRPARMRGYAPVTSEIQLESDGSNVSAVLYDICERQALKEEVLDFVRKLPEGEIEDIRFIKTERNDVMLQIQETFGRLSRTWDAAVLSDGTLRVLAVAAALLSAPPGSLVVIEEIDNGVHPSRVRGLIDKISRLVEERNLRVLLTTHNPAFLDALPLALWPGVVYCYRSLEEGDSHLVRLIDLPNYVSLATQGSLGQMLSQGMIERALGRGKQQRSYEESVQDFLRWMEEQEWEVPSHE